MAWEKYGWSLLMVKYFHQLLKKFEVFCVGMPCNIAIRETTCLHLQFILKMGAEGSSETLVSYNITRLHNPGDFDSNLHRRENLNTSNLILQIFLAIHWNRSLITTIHKESTLVSWARLIPSKAPPLTPTTQHVPELSRRLNSMKSSQDTSCVRCLYETDVSGTILIIIIIRDLIWSGHNSPLMMLMRATTLPDPSVTYRHLTQLIAREDFMGLTLQHYLPIYACVSQAEFSPSRSPTETSYAFLNSHVCYMFCPSLPPWSGNPNYI
jgi:hypothetical protein